MAKLYLKFEQNVLKEFTLAQGTVTIGRLPDNLIQVDNLAVSGHHAKIYWDTDHYVLEDNNSLNGTYLNNQRVSKSVLKDGDSMLIGKHTLVFKDEWHEDTPGQHTLAADRTTMPAVPKLEATVVLDTKKAKEMMAAARAAKEGAPAAAPPAAPPPAEAGGAPAAAAPAAPAPAAPAAPAAPPKERTGVLSVLAGKTDEPQYTLSGKLTVIGKSEMASIKLKGWFAPKVAATISRRDSKYFIAASEKAVKVKVNGADIAGQKELAEGDVIEVAGIKLSFAYHE
ncbi:MAG TPA: FHA domain-containing protein [Terriglobales bacterium]|nr:FHA domain-containing protein [Terriglobales bacterium]